MRFRTADGLNLVGDTGGRLGAPSVVLLHGGGQTRHSFAGAMNRLVEAGYYVVNYDARGHGDSDWSPDGDYNVRSLASDLTSIVATIPGPVAFVGASLGGLAGFYAIGSSDPPIAQALVLLDVVLRPSESGSDRIRQFMVAYPDGFATLDEAADAVAAFDPSRPRPTSPKGLLKNLRQRSNGRLYWHWDPRVVEEQFKPPSRADMLVAVSHGVTVPTLILRGAQSKFVDEAGLAEMARLLPQVEIQTVAGAGHMVTGDRNDAFTMGMVDFLQKHMPAVA